MALNDKPPFSFEIAIGENADRIPIEKYQDDTKLNYIDAFSKLFAERLNVGGIPLQREEFNEFLYMFSKTFSWYQFGNEVGWIDEIGGSIGYPLGARLIYYQNNDVTKRRVLISTKDNNTDDFTKNQSFINQSWFVENGFGIGSEIRWTATDKIIQIGSKTYQVGQFVDEYHPNLTIGGIWKTKWNTDSVFTRTEGNISNEDRLDGIQLDSMQKLTGEFVIRATGVGRLILGSSGILTNTNINITEHGVQEQNSPRQRERVTLDNSRQARTSTENRSKNILERIMIRVG